MFHTQEKTVERNLGREALDVFQGAISPNWLLKVILGTSLVFTALVVVAYSI